MTVEVIDLDFAYRSANGDRVIFTGASHCFEACRLHAVTGPSGSGKTTMLGLLCAEIIPDSGRVLIGSTEPRLMDPVRLRRSVIGRIYQDYRMIPHLSALDNVRLPQEVAGTLKSAPGRAEYLLDAVGLGSRMNSPVANLSGGEQQRVAVARALVNSPTVVLADEPTGSLDEEASAEIGKLLAGIARELDVTVIVVTHDPLVASFADAIVQVRDHRLKVADR